MAHITPNNNGSTRAPYGTIGDAIRKLREDRQMTQRQLGKKVRRCQSAIASYESGRICPSVETTKRLALEFNVPYEFILGHRRTLFPTG